MIYIDDWLSSKNIQMMDAPEERGYLHLLLRAAKELDAGLPDDDAVLANLSLLGQQWWRPTKDKLKRVGAMTSGQKIRGCFFSQNGRVYNERLLREVERFNASRETRVSKAKAAANARWHAPSNACDMPPMGRGSKVSGKQNSPEAEFSETEELSVREQEQSPERLQQQREVGRRESASPVDQQHVENVSGSGFEGVDSPDSRGAKNSALRWFRQQFIGEWRADTGRVFAECVNTPELAETFRCNLPLWMQTGKYQNGAGKDSFWFVKSGIWQSPPNDSLMPKVRKSRVMEAIERA